MRGKRGGVCKARFLELHICKLLTLEYRPSSNTHLSEYGSLYYNGESVGTERNHHISDLLTTRSPPSSPQTKMLRQLQHSTKSLAALRELGSSSVGHFLFEFKIIFKIHFKDRVTGVG